MCSPGENSSVADMFPTNCMTPVRVPPVPPGVQKKLPPQLMPRAVTEIVLKRIERRKLRRIAGGLVLDGLSVGDW